MDNEERIIDRAVEKALLLIPEVIGNLITHHISVNKINKDFYTKNPELQKHRELVASVIEKVEGNNLPMEYSKLIDMALPEIQKRVKETKGLDMETIEPPSLSYNGEF